MISNAVAFVIDTLFTLFILAFLVRFWMQVFRAPFYNPLAQFTMSLTSWAVKPMRRVIPGAFKLDLASLLLAFIFDGGQLTGGQVEGDEIVCPRHGARFCIRTGEALTAPAYEPTSKFPVRVENGEIQVRDDRWD